MKREVRSTDVGGGDREDEERLKTTGLTDRLYFTKITGLPEPCNVNAFSLSELLEIISPTASIHFSYTIDPSWLLAQYPDRFRRGPIALIVGERMGTNSLSLKAAVSKCAADNIRVGKARLAIPFGTHHSKISIFESDTGKVHIIISTANLLEHDWEHKTQAFYHCSGTLQAGGSGDGSSQNESVFQTDLIKYLDEYKSSRDWGLIEYWRNRVANVDLSHVKAQVVYSVPGSHKGNKLTQYGHPRLQNLLKEVYGDTKADDFTYHVLCSSIGNLGVTAESWLTGQFLSSLAGGIPADGSQLRLIYPCVEDVRNSNEGYEAGGSLPCDLGTAAKQSYLMRFMHKWRSDQLGRTLAMPHIKTYAAFAKNSMKPFWLLVTSANLSKAAWGVYRVKRTQLTIRSYEFGLLFTDPESLGMLPYDVPLTEYSVSDRMWIIDRQCKQPDIFQKT